MKKSRSVSRSVKTEPTANWAIEIERTDGSPSEFFSVVALQAGAEELQIVTPGGTQVSFKVQNIRRVLLMRPNDKSS